jgi:hypothetical protein
MEPEKDVKTKKEMGGSMKRGQIAGESGHVARPPLLFLPYSMSLRRLFIPLRVVRFRCCSQAVLVVTNHFYEALTSQEIPGILVTTIVVTSIPGRSNGDG